VASRAALVHCGDHWENQRRVLPLCFALEAQGWEPVVLTYRRHTGARFLRHGFDVYPLAPRGGALAIARTAGSLLARSAGRFRAWGVDPTTIASLERLRAPDRYETRGRRQERRIRLALRLRALHHAMIRVSPGHVFVWNGWTGEVANALRLMCEGASVPHGFLERGLLPDSVFVDPRGTGGDSELATSSLEALGRAEVPAEVELPPAPPLRDATLLEKHGLKDRRVVFVPLQVQRDTNVLFHSDHVKSMGDLVVRVSRALPEDAIAVVRRHPEEVDRVGLPALPNVRYVDDATAEAWCDAADLVVTVNSTVGLTALLRGRPVVALGRGLYANKGLCAEPEAGRLDRALRDRATWMPPEWERVRRFHRVLLGRHTAFDRFAPAVLPRPTEDAAASRGPFNPWALSPRGVAAAWAQALAQARAARGPIEVWSQLGRAEVLDLTYRRDREPVDDDHVGRVVRELLDLDGPPTVTASPAPGRQKVVVCAQTARAIYDDHTLLVLDPYGEPHLGWLAHRVTEPHSHTAMV
jgi:hypothetical protein